MRRRGFTRGIFCEVSGKKALRARNILITRTFFHRAARAENILVKQPRVSFRSAGANDRAAHRKFASRYEINSAGLPWRFSEDITGPWNRDITILRGYVELSGVAINYSKTNLVSTQLEWQLGARGGDSGESYVLEFRNSDCPPSLPDRPEAGGRVVKKRSREI